MATEFPSVTQVGNARTSANVMAGHNNSKVIISIDDTALLHSPIEPIRALSLNRLDSLDDGGTKVYRCPSFPRLQKRCNSQLDSITNCSMTHLEANSMSPRWSTDDLTNITRDDYHSRDHLSLGENPGLICSVSSRMVDELPPLDFPVTQFERLGHAYLSRIRSLRINCLSRCQGQRPARLWHTPDAPPVHTWRAQSQQDWINQS